MEWPRLISLLRALAKFRMPRQQHESDSFTSPGQATGIELRAARWQLPWYAPVAGALKQWPSWPLRRPPAAFPTQWLSHPNQDLVKCQMVGTRRRPLARLRVPPTVVDFIIAKPDPSEGLAYDSRRVCVKYVGPWSSALDGGGHEKKSLRFSQSLDFFHATLHHPTLSGGAGPVMMSLTSHATTS